MNRKIKVFHIVPNLAVGGGEKLAVDICTFLDKEVYTCKIISLYKSQNTIYEQIARENNIDIIFLNKKIGVDLKIIVQLIKLLKKENPDILHTHLYVMSYVLPASIFCNIRSVVHTVHSVANKELRKSVRIIMHIAYKVFGVIPVAISNHIKQTVYDEYGIEKEKIRCIYNGVDTLKFQRKKQIENTNILEFVHIGRFNTVKNHKLLIESFALALNEINNIKLKLVGDGELRKEIEELVESLKIKDKVTFRGIRKEIPNELKDADIFILTSNWEGIPLSIIEAMASGLSIISTKAGGVADIIEDNKTGLLVNIGDKVGLSKAIIRISKDEKLRQKMAKEALKEAEKYDIRIKVKEYEELYKQCIK